MNQDADNARYLYDENSLKLVKTAQVTVAASQTDSSVVAAVAGKRIKVISYQLIGMGVSNTIAINTKPAGAGTAITPTYTVPASNSIVVSYSPKGHFQSAVGEGVTVTTGATASNLGVLLNYIEAEA